MHTIRNKFTYTAIAIMTAMLILISTVSGGAVTARAADTTSAAYEARNVMEDLNGATVDGEPIDLSQYTLDAHKTVQLISFVEFCYSPFEEKQSDYGLYVYLYNPRGLDWTRNESLNKIQFSYGGGTGYAKYNLVYLNRSEEPGKEGLFYKFKIALTGVERATILGSINSSERVYEVSGIELYSSGVNAIEYEIANTYTYKGYAQGYGSDSASESTLSCTSDELKTISLDVHSTYWRPNGTHSDGYTKDTLHSVYFSVPNETINEYGEMTAVHATWLNAYTAPILVTGNKDIYNTLYPYLAQYVEGGTSTENYSSDLKYALIATKAAEGNRDDLSNKSYCKGFYAYNAYSDDFNKVVLPYIEPEYDKYLYYLNYLFYADGGNADTFILPAEKLVGDKSKGIKGWFETFTESFGSIEQKAVSSNPDNGTLVTGPDSATKGGLINGKYSAVLFDDVDKAFTDVTITSDTSYKLTDNTVSDTIWDRLFGTTLKKEHSYNMSAIQRVTVSDINYYPNKEIFCDKYYVAENDYDEFCAYVMAAENKDETVYLFRYYQSEYISHEVTEYERIVSRPLIGKPFGQYKVTDTNAHFAQMWVQLDFDIIDLTFTKSDVKTVIPVVMSPMDIAAGVEPPASTQPEKFISDWWKYALGISAGLIGVIIVSRIIKGLRRI